MKKLVENVVKLELVKNEVSENEASDFKIKAIVAHTDIVNDNGFYLDGDVIEFKRDTYPFLFNHSANDLLGETKTVYDAEQKAYVSEITIYDTKQDIIKAVKNGVYDSVSIGYYIDDYEFQEDGDAIIVHHAIMNEISLVSVGADSDAKLVANEFREEKQAHILAQNKLKELKKSYE